MELLVVWSEKFAKSQNSKPSRFKIIFTDLKNSGVIFPDYFMFVEISRVKSKEKTKKTEVDKKNIAYTGDWSADSHLIVESFNEALKSCEDTENYAKNASMNK